MATKYNVEELISGHYSDIIVNLDVTPSLVHEMAIRCNMHGLQKKTLNSGNQVDKSTKMITYLKIGDLARYTAFCDALEAIGESTLADKWRNPPISKAKDDILIEIDQLRTQSLTKYQKRLLSKHWNKILENIDIDSVLPLLNTDFPPYKFKSIMCIENVIRKTEEVLMYLEKSHQRFYINFIKALHESGQSHIATNYFVESDTPEVSELNALEQTRQLIDSERETINKQLAAVAITSNILQQQLEQVNVLRDHLTVENKHLQNVREQRSLLEPIMQTTESVCCSICMDASVNTVFTECGHAVCCETCVTKLIECPMCRRRSKWTKLYF